MSLLKLMAALLIYSVGRIFNRTSPDIWLIGERKNEAKDNGFHLFKYIRVNHPDVKIFYVITENSKHVAKVSPYGQIIRHNSFSHYLAFFKARILILTFEKSTFPDSVLIWYAHRLGLLNKKVAYIKHGIIKENLVHHKYNSRIRYDLFVCGAEAERQFVIEGMGYPPSVAQYLGLARFDSLIDTHVSKQIFYMPTWRRWLSNCGERDFEKTDYFINIYGLLSDPSLSDLLNSYDVNLYFYLHDSIQAKYSGLFIKVSDRIIICNSSEHDVQLLMKESSLMLTDFSSVAFDFAYMRKPVIYFQFDEAEYYSNHYLKAYFDYRENGFGPVFREKEDVISAISNHLKGDSSNNDIYVQRVESFFGGNDGRNCERIYEAICRL